MGELLEGQSVLVQGSASKPYQIKNVAGVLSCSCPAWRFQSLPIESRSCRHIRAFRGDASEDARVGQTSAVAPRKEKYEHAIPPLLLAESWDPTIDPTGWHLSEKLDGVRAWWDGKVFLSRQGNRYFAPDWFTAGLPLEPLDGELWIGRKQFQRTVNIVRRQDQSRHWEEVHFCIFDAPGEDGGFEKRLKLVHLIMEMNQPPFALAHPHIPCKGSQHLHHELDRAEALGGEGLMLRQPHSPYHAGRSSTLLKVKRFKDDEARVIGYQPGSGRHKGRMGALLVEMDNGVEFEIGTGFTDAERISPAPIGSTVTFKYQELTERGAPRFASFVGVRNDVAANHQLFTQGDALSTIINRRFEFIGGGSDKFWEVAVRGNDVVVRFGRNGTSGQTEIKSFTDPVTANKQAEKKIAEKIKKGYVEVK